MKKSHEQKFRFSIRLAAFALCSVGAFLAIFSFAEAARASDPGPPWCDATKRP